MQRFPLWPSSSGSLWDALAVLLWFTSPHLQTLPHRAPEPSCLGADSQTAYELLLSSHMSFLPHYSEILRAEPMS